MKYFSEEQVFLLFFVIGILISAFFDMFRALRKNFKSNDTITFIQDLIFLIIIGILIVFSIIKINRGIIRFYIFISIFLGITTYFLTISNFCVIILTIFVKICKKIIKIPYKYFKFLKKICKNSKKKDF